MRIVLAWAVAMVALAFFSQNTMAESSSEMIKVYTVDGRETEIPKSGAHRLQSSPWFLL
jgi:hypothetical protein